MGTMNIIYFLQENPHMAPIKAAALMDPGNVLGNKNYPIVLKNYPFMIIWSSYFRAHMKGSMSPKSGDKEFILTPNLDDTIFSNHINFTDYSTLQYHPLLQTTQIKKFLTNPENRDLGEGDGYLITMTINQQLLNYFHEHLS